MDSMRSLNTSLPGSAAHKQNTQNDSPEQLLDAFKAAALSVTKLYKTSAASQAKARLDGYQDCLDDLLTFLDKENIGVDDGEGWRIRKWATERLDNRESPSHILESEDENDKAETASSPELNRTNSATQLSTVRPAQARTDSAPPPSHTPVEPTPIVVPTQDNFTFQSSHPWPPQQDAYMSLANLDLSDSRSHDIGGTVTATATTNATNTSTRAPRSRQQRGTGRQGAQLGRGAGAKRKINFAEIFDLGSLNDKNMFGGGGGGGGGGGKRSRHA